MKKSKTNKILQNIAVKHGKTVPEIRSDIEEAIEIAYANRNNTDSEFWNQWKSKPNVEQVLSSITAEVLAQMNFGEK